MRGATLRKIAARSGISLARVTSAYANKDELIAACFADVVDRDLARLAAMAEEAKRNVDFYQQVASTDRNNNAGNTRSWMKNLLSSLEHPVAAARGAVAGPSPSSRR